MLNFWLHLIALAVFLGAVLGLWMMLLPAASILRNDRDKVEFLARGLKIYNPVQIGALGVLLFTGAFQLTELKAAYRELFIKQMGYNLSIKLCLAFALVLCIVYQSMGIAHRFVKQHESGNAVTTRELSSIVKKLKSANGLILILALLTLWFGLRLHS